MLAKSRRLPRAAFSSRPTGRARFKYGSVAYISHIPAAVGIVVSKKVSKTAPIRNKIRRRVAHALIPLLPTLKRSAIVYPTLDTARVPYIDLQNALADIL